MTEEGEVLAVVVRENVENTPDLSVAADIDVDCDTSESFVLLW